jgi:hypothetical protein
MTALGPSLYRNGKNLALMSLIVKIIEYDMFGKNH